jgi:hypothetical protein
MVGLSALLVLGGVGLWQKHGSAASLESHQLQPMIAAAATPIWRALPEAPTVKPEPPDLRAQAKSQRVTYPTYFQPAAVREATPTISAVSSREPTGVTSAALPTTVASEAMAEHSPPAVSEPAENAPSDPPVVADPVSGRYGL